MWWIKKKKKTCKCPCHWSNSLRLWNPQDTHCRICTQQIRAARLARKDPNSSPVLRRKLHTVTSMITRIRADWTCAKCKRRYHPVMSKRTGMPAQNLMTTSHYWGRKASSVTWDDRNLDAMCIFCHQKVENNKHDFIEGFCYEKYMREKLGDKGYEELEIAARSISSFTAFELKTILSEKENQLSILLKNYV